MEQCRGGRQRDSSKDTPIVNNNSVKNLTDDLANKSTTTGPRDGLIAGLDCHDTKTPVRTDMTVSCQSCTFEVTCWTMKLPKQIMENHKHIKHPRGTTQARPDHPQ